MSSKSATHQEDRGWQIAQRQREHPGRFRAVLRQQEQPGFKVSIPLVFLAGLAFEGFFGLRNQRLAEVTLNIVTVVFLLGWVLQTIHRKTLSWKDPALGIGCLLLVAGSLESLSQVFDTHWAELFLKTVGTICILFALDRLERNRVLEMVRNSEEYLESIFESIPDPLFVLGDRRSILAGNRIAIDTFGPEVLGRTPCETILNHDDCRSCCVTEAFKKRKPRFEIVRDEHGARRFEVTTFPLYDRCGFSGRLIQQVRDVSTQSRTEDDASIYQDAVNSVRDGVLILDLEGRLVRSNRGAKNVIGLDRVGAAPRDATELLPFKEEVNRDEFLQALKRPVPWEREVTLSMPGGERTVILYLSPIRSADHRLLGTVVLVRDVTEVKSLQNQLVQNEKMSALGALVSGVAHELNNPLTAVYGFAQILLDSTLSEDDHGKVEQICTYAERCRRIIEGLLRFARSHHAERVRGNVNDVVREAIELVSGQVRLANVELRIDLEDEMPDSMMDPIQLQQVLINLVTNAQHATEHKTGGRIEVRTRRMDEQSLAIEVSDNGQGMPESVQKKIFEPFFTTKEVGRGTGLGLALSYGTIRDHGGKIHVWSEVGVGTSFRLHLPVIKPPGSAVKRQQSEQSASPGPKHVLVVDDEPAVLEVLSHFLVADGHEVVTCEQAKEALEAAKRQGFDLVFTDWRMPGMDGEALNEALIEQHPELRGRVVFITGDTLDTRVVKVAKRDGNTLINKPFTVEAVREVVASVGTNSGAPT